MKILITGVTGQDGSYLAEQLAADGHEVWGLLRGQGKHHKRNWLEELVPSIKFVHADLLDQSSLISAIKYANPDVVYNLGALTFVGMSWEQPALMTEVTGLGVLRLLEAIRATNPQIRFLQASSSEQFGSSLPPQDENTMFHPRSPYGVAKTMAHHTVVNYRESYGMFASTAIMFNHTSPRRGLEFVERKATHGAAQIVAGKQRWLHMGRLGAYRDWGWAPDYVRGLRLIADHHEPGDFVLATGVMHSVEQMVDTVFGSYGLNWMDFVAHDQAMVRPAEVEALRGDATKARLELGWEPVYDFEAIMEELAAYDWHLVEKEENPCP